MTKNKYRNQKNQRKKLKDLTQSALFLFLLLFKQL